MPVLVTKPIGVGRERYFLDGPGPGRWHGGAAAALGLAGVVTQEALRDVLAGRRLPNTNRRRRAGFDLIFAAPKSVSLLAALAPPVIRRAIVEAHEAAVVDALGFLERHAARATRAHHGQRILIPTDGLAAAAFRH